MATGKVGGEVSVGTGAECARLAALNAMAAVAAAAGGVDEIERVVKVTVFVASTPDFTAQAQVANGASELLGEVFGSAGRHARSAVGTAVLPMDAPVEVELIAAITVPPTHPAPLSASVCADAHRLRRGAAPHHTGRAGSLGRAGGVVVSGWADGRGSGRRQCGPAP